MTNLQKHKQVWQLDLPFENGIEPFWDGGYPHNLDAHTSTDEERQGEIYKEGITRISNMGQEQHKFWMTLQLNLTLVYYRYV